jgi:hypothetical protein
MVDRPWFIFPLLLGVPYNSIELVRLTGPVPKHRLKVRTQKERDRLDQYYSSLVDQNSLKALVMMGAESSLAEQALRASSNLCHNAVSFIIAGKIPFNPHIWEETLEN